MRSVKDTFILSSASAAGESQCKSFALVPGAGCITDKSHRKEILFGESEGTFRSVESALAAVGCLVYLYTKRNKFMVTYYWKNSGMIPFAIREDACLDQIVSEICNNNSNRYRSQKPHSLYGISDVAFCMSDHDTNKAGECNHPIVFSVSMTKTKLAFSAVYNTSVYGDKFVRQLGRHWVKIYQDIVSNASMHICDITLNSKEDTMEQIAQIRNLQLPCAYDYKHSIVEEFYRDVNAHLGDAAICDEKGEVTYKRLQQYSDRVAEMLREEGVQRGDIVVIIGRRSREMIYCIWGSLKCGAAYVPVDEELPEARITSIIEDIKPKKVIALDKGEAAPWDIPLPDKPGDCTEEFAYEKVGSEDCAYVLYTSGTTDVPKGVMIKHSGVVNLSRWFGETYDLSNNRNVLHMTNISFDVSVEEIIVTILNYATVYIIPQEIRFNKSAFAEYINRNQIHIAQFVPVTLKALLKDNARMESLTAVICGGDKLDDKLKDTMLNMGYPLFNHYGPTEFTVDAIAGKFDEASNDLGHPIANTEVYVLDDKNKLLPYGIAGELCIAGAGESLGYFNNKSLTDKTFVWNEFLERRVYKTGDLAVMMPEGNVRFLGRMDQQIKVNGIRIEPGEIEYYMQQYEGIEEAVVVEANSFDNKVLYAYYKSEMPIVHNKIKEHMGKYLPMYMVPNHYIGVNEWPMTENGKINRKVLCRGDYIAEKQRYIAPGNETEREVSRVWKRLLGESKISIDEEFANVGGDSLRASILSNHLLETYKIQVPLNEIFVITIRELADLITRETAVASSEDKDENLVLLKRGSRADKNIFFIHAGNGEVEAFVDLCDNLAVDYNMWGIRADRLEGYSPRNICLEMVAENYVRKVESVQKEGIINLIGWCIGGSIAFEMALRLEEMGRQIGVFAMLNSFAPDREFWGEIPSFDVNSERELINSFPEHKAFFEQLKDAEYENIWASLVEFYKKKEVTANEFKPYVYDDMDRAIPNYDAENIRIEDIIYYINVLRTFDNVRAPYVPEKKVRTQVCFFRALDEKAANMPVWNTYCEKELKVYDIPGNNFTILRYPDVREFAEILNGLLYTEERTRNEETKC